MNETYPVPPAPVPPVPEQAPTKSIITFTVVLVVLNVLVLIIDGVSTFQFDARASFYPVGDRYIVFILLLAIPLLMLWRSYRINRRTFRVQAVIFAIMVMLGLAMSSLAVLQGWREFCPGYQIEAGALQGFYRDYCASHSVPILPFIDHTVMHYLSIGGVAGDNIFMADEMGTPSWDVQSFVAQAKQAAANYSQGTGISHDIACKFAIDPSYYNRSAASGMEKMVSGELTLATATNAAGRSDLPGLCSRLLPDTITGSNRSGTGFGGCSYDVGTPGNVLFFRAVSDINKAMNVPCMPAVTYQKSDFTFSAAYVDGHLQQ